ncbi:uncharacterized protein LOC110115564 [Dendrobium catenatum]|uniref:uncharacterized protein LOC110115564 n=1 Tax=Dendrobium catenatum TaxID=906689 RepID=UPI0009F1A227|nr:uncharacterized protein LOC110115564 [Dendrobium catenatum]
MILKVNKFVRNSEEIGGCVLASEIDALGRENEVEDSNLLKNSMMMEKRDNNVDGDPVRNDTKENFTEAWKKPQHIKISFSRDLTEMSDDGIVVMLNAEKEVLNTQVLRHSLVIKILCSFKSAKAMDEVLNGGPWYVGGHIIGMDKWPPLFNPNSFKGITAPVWIRLAYLPLYCWDEENIAIIASRVGVPMFVDGNSFKWGKREFAWVYVRLNLENRLPNGVWVDGIAGRFFQKIEYEKIDLICYHYGKAGHDRKGFPEV